MSEKNLATIDDVCKLDLRVGIVESASDLEGTDKIMKLMVSFGNESRQILAGIRPDYTTESMVGKRIVAIINLEPRKIRGEVSHGMLFAVKNGDLLSLVTVDKDVEAGSTLG